MGSPRKWLNINQLGLTSSMQPNIKRNKRRRFWAPLVSLISVSVQQTPRRQCHSRHIWQNSTMTTNRQDKKDWTKRLVVVDQPSKTHRSCKFYLQHTELLTNLAYQSSDYKPQRVWDSLVANTEALKLQSIKTHMELKDDISDVSFIFFISRYY